LIDNTLKGSDAMNKHNAIKKAMLQRLSAEDRDIPKYVQDKAEFFEKEKGYDTGYAFSTAWSIYCKYKNPGDKAHCTKDPSEYFTGKKANFKSAGAVKEMLMDAIFESIKYLEDITGLDLSDDDILFELTQDYVMNSFKASKQMQIEKLLFTKGVSKFLIGKFLKKVQFETQEVPF
jgi:hypothetical protein